MRTNPLEQRRYAANVGMNRKNRQIEVCLVSARAIWMYFRRSRALGLDVPKIFVVIGWRSHATMLIQDHFKFDGSVLTISYEFVTKV